MIKGTRIEITNVLGNTKNKFVGKKGIALSTYPYDLNDDYMMEVILDNYHIKMLFRLSELKIIEEKE
jgi:hypothetical protein